jgi:predicted phage terminase large subunit-like protein
MLSRSRSATAGFAPYIRATSNPDADSWVRELVDWWIDPDTGLPIPERTGVLRWFVNFDDTLYWADSRKELIEKLAYLATPETPILPKSFTFIPSRIYDNKILMEKDPTYLANLLALSKVDRERLLGGNWNTRATAGTLFRREWFPIIEAIPAGWIAAIRFWDRAATKPHSENPDPDWTRGLLMFKYPNGSYVVGDLKSMRDTPGQVEQFIKNVASHDGHYVRVMSQQDPGSAGKSEGLHFVQSLPGFDVRLMTTSKAKVVRAKPVSAQAEVHNIHVVRAPWNREFFQELENFPEGAHDDIVDVLSGAFNEIAGGVSIADVC